MARGEGGGRPPIEIDEELVAKLATIQCTMIEIANIVGCSVDTLERRFAETIKTNQQRGRSSLRRWQWKAAEKGNTAMLIWLGKQFLGQTEKIEQKQESTNNVKLVGPMTKEMAETILAQEKAEKESKA